MIGSYISNFPVLVALIAADEAKLESEREGIRDTLRGQGAVWYTSKGGEKTWAWLMDTGPVQELWDSHPEVEGQFFTPEQTYGYYGRDNGDGTYSVVKKPWVYDEEGNRTLKDGVVEVAADSEAAAAFAACYNTSPVEIKDDQGNGTGQYSTPDPMGSVIQGYDREHLLIV